MVIKTKFLDHKGGIYIYRTHNQKVKELCNNGLQNLQNYLEKMYEKCPDNYFSNKGPRSSSLKFKLAGEGYEEEYGHEVSVLAGHGLQINFERFKDNHSRVQVFMLEHDKKTIAMEVPLWMHSEELNGYEELFDTEEEMSGHIDVLRIEDGKIWIWDYKPNAHREKYAATQVYFYATMLSKRTGIPLENFRCGYFDNNVAFTFDPNTARIPQTKKLDVFA